MLFPKAFYDSVFDIPISQLWTEGYRVMLFDVDNTLIPREEKLLTLQYLNWIEKVKDLGFTVLLVSNNSSKRRIRRVAKQCQVKGIYFSCKPLVYSTRALLKREGFTPKEAIFVGDQVLTDVAMGNWARLYTILVEPINKKLSFIKTVQRNIEIWLLQQLDPHWMDD